MPRADRFWNAKPGSEKYWQCPGEIGSGTIDFIKFRPGLMLGIGNYCFWEDLSINFEFKSMPFILMGFIISANSEITFNLSQNKKDIIINSHGQSYISYLLKQQGVHKYPAGSPTRTVGVYLAPSLLNTFIGGRHDLVPEEINDIVSGADEKYFQVLPRTLEVTMVLQQIINCRYQGHLKRLYLESKALELITHTLAQMAADKNGHKTASPSILRTGDLERVHEARELLTCDLENPPSLLDLARQTGINKNKLNQGFRQVFGTSVFDYLRIYRLERAKTLLKSNAGNVTETAFEVGYAHQSNFTKAFKKHFNKNPADFLR